MRRRFFVLAIASVVGCTLLNPLDAYDRGSPHDAGGDDVVTPGDAGPDGGCIPARWPSPPADNGGAGDGTIEFLNAVSTLDLGGPAAEGGRRAVSSYDLDGICTCPGPGSCKPPAGVKDTCDGPGGADNAGGELVVALTGLGLLDAEITKQIALGEYGLLFKVSGYNGGPNDTTVALSVFLSNGMAGSEVDGGTRRLPAFDGADEWTINPASVTGTSGPPYRPRIELSDVKAYVGGGILVARLTFPVQLGPLTMALTGCVLTGRIIKDALGYHIEDGRFVGRWPTAKMLPAFGAIEDRTRGFPNAGVCGDSGVYPQIKTKVCGALDIAAAEKDDGKGTSCNALAISMRFSSTMSRFGALFAPASQPAFNCPPNWADDCVP